MSREIAKFVLHLGMVYSTWWHLLENFATIYDKYNRPTRWYMYTVNHKKGGSTFVIITLENLDGF